VARAAIVLDNTTTAATSRSSSLTFSHTVGGGSDRLLVVCIAVEEDSFDANVSTVTYNGVAMTNAVDRIVGSTTDLNVEIWYMLDASLPPTGSYDVVITCPDIVGTSDILASAISVTGAAQAGPEATAGSGVLLDVTPGVGTDPVVVNEDSFVFEWFEIIGVHDGQYVIDIQTGGDNGTYQNLMIHDFGVTDSGRAMHVDGTGTMIRNVMIWDGTRHGIWVNDSAGATIENCTVYGMNYHGINVRTLATATIRNTIAVNNGVATFAADFNIADGDADYFGYNMWQEATNFDPEACTGCVGNNWAPPSNLDSLFVSITPGSEDLHLETIGNRAINRGIDLSGTFTDDGDGDSRVMDWDIGADEGLGGLFMPRVIQWTEVSPY
jgi:parallel beta-helix repeat protein